jgi:hypothetical protein
MKRIISIVIAMALLGQAVAFAQDSGEPSEQSVLDVARAKYQADQEADGASGAQAAPASEARDDKVPEEPFPFTPVLLSFVPGVSFPFGTYDVNVAGGMIGSITRDVSGAEGSGVFNISRDVRGGQGAGVFNISSDVRGGQGAGVFNISDSIHGIQGAGVFNIAKGVRGFQGAGVFNIAGDVSGGQAAGLFNRADSVKGVQIGVVNIADNIDGVQIGLINIAGNGIRSLGLAFEPSTSYAYASWQVGSPFLYTLASLGVPYRDWDPDWRGTVAGLGLGSRSRLLGMIIDVDLSAEAAIGALPYDTIARSRNGDCDAWEGWAMIKPYPALRISASLPIGRHWKAFAGLKADFEVDALGERVPEALKAGEGYRGKLFHEAFTVWPKWFFGLKM